MMYVVTHDDVDGIASHAIITKYLEECGEKDIAHSFANYRNAEKILGEIAAGFGEGDHLMLADLGYTRERFGNLFDNGSKLENGFWWRDHHEWKEDDKERISKLGDVAVIRGICGSEIVKNELLPDNTVAAELAKIAHAHDFHKSGEAGDEYYRIACMIQDVITSGYDKMDIVKELAAGRIWNNSFEEAYRQYIPKKERAIEAMKETISTYAIKPEATVTMAFVPEIIESKDARHWLMEREKSDGVILLWESGRVAIEVADENHLPLLGKMKRIFKAGGRGLVAGGSYDGKMEHEKNYREYFDDIAQMLNEYVLR